MRDGNRIQDMTSPIHYVSLSKRSTYSLTMIHIKNTILSLREYDGHPEEEEEEKEEEGHSSSNCGLNPQIR